MSTGIDCQYMRNGHGSKAVAMNERCLGRYPCWYATREIPT